MSTRRDLHQQLEELRAELASSALSAAERSRIERLIADIREHLEDERHEPQSLVDRLQDAVAEFEETHPRLTLVFGAVADSLSRLGI